MYKNHHDGSHPDCFFFNDTATTEIYTLSLHDALPIGPAFFGGLFWRGANARGAALGMSARSEEHTFELQSHSELVCRLLLEKKKRRAVPSPLLTANANRHGGVRRPTLSGVLAGGAVYFHFARQPRVEIQLPADFFF